MEPGRETPEPPPGDKARTLESQLDAAVTEASSIKQVLDEAAGLFKQHQDEVEEHAKQVDSNSRLAFTGNDGEVRILPPSGHSTLSGEAAKDAEDLLAKLRTDLQMKVQLGLAKARNLAVPKRSPPGLVIRSESTSKPVVECANWSTA